MTKVIVWTNSVGETIITTPAPSLIARLGGVDAAIVHIKSRKDCIRVDATNINVRHQNDIPFDWTFRDVWKHDLSVDMSKARNIQMTRIHATRDSELCRLDIELSKALGKNDLSAATEIERRRQILRDIPQTFDLTNAEDAHSLAKLWPIELERW